MGITGNNKIDIWLTVFQLLISCHILLFAWSTVPAKWVSNGREGISQSPHNLARKQKQMRNSLRSLFVLNVLEGKICSYVRVRPVQMNVFFAWLHESGQLKCRDYDLVFNQSHVVFNLAPPPSQKMWNKFFKRWEGVCKNVDCQFPGKHFTHAHHENTIALNQ